MNAEQETGSDDATCPLSHPQQLTASTRSAAQFEPAAEIMCLTSEPYQPLIRNHNAAAIKEVETEGNRVFEEEKGPSHPGQSQKLQGFRGTRGTVLEAQQKLKSKDHLAAETCPTWQDRQPCPERREAGKP